MLVKTCVELTFDITGAEALVSEKWSCPLSVGVGVGSHKNVFNLTRIEQILAKIRFADMPLYNL